MRLLQLSVANGPTELGGAINAPTSSGSYMGYHFYPFSQAQCCDPQTCANACNAQSAYDSRHPAADGTYKSCVSLHPIFSRRCSLLTSNRPYSSPMSSPTTVLPKVSTALCIIRLGDLHTPQITVSTAAVTAIPCPAPISTHCRRYCLRGLICDLQVMRF